MDPRVDWALALSSLSCPRSASQDILLWDLKWLLAYGWSPEGSRTFSVALTLWKSTFRKCHSPVGGRLTRKRIATASVLFSPSPRVDFFLRNLWLGLTCLQALLWVDKYCEQNKISDRAKWVSSGTPPPPATLVVSTDFLRPFQPSSLEITMLWPRICVWLRTWVYRANKPRICLLLHLSKNH